MKNELNFFITETKKSWKSINIESLLKRRSLLENLAKNEIVRKSLQENLRNLFKGTELYRDEEYGFVLLAYAENKGTYRVPHNHGNAWVEYAVVSGIVEMGNYINLAKSCSLSKLVLKSTDQLVAGDCHKYLPGEIHDTRCISEDSIILRLTSCDLKVEEREGRMLRFKL
jgi:hypothetical protein